MFTKICIKCCYRFLRAIGLVRGSPHPVDPPAALTVMSIDKPLAT